MYEDFSIVEQDYAKARRKLRNIIQEQANSIDDRLPRIALLGRSTPGPRADRQDRAPAVPGIRELPLN
jgi:hypothetical protein